VTYLAATLPAVPTGFWDREPKPTPGRLRRLLSRTPSPESYPLPEQLRKKVLRFQSLAQGYLGTPAHKTGRRRLKTPPGDQILVLSLGPQPLFIRL